MPIYIIERVTITRERFEVVSLSPAEASRKALGDPLLSTTDVDIQISLAGAPKQKGKKAAGAKGTRIPADWEPDSVYAKSKGMVDQEIDREAEKFRNYWAARPGQGGVKLDWSRTWYTWCMTFCERAGRAPPTMALTPTIGMVDAQWRKALDMYWANSRWHLDYGPEPGRPGCKVPQHLLPEALKGPREMKALPAPDLFVR